VIDTNYLNRPRRGTVKKLSAFTAIAFGVIALTSCTVEVSPSEDNSRPTPTTEYVAPSQSIEDIYLEVIYEEYPHLYSQMGDRALIEFGYTACDAIDEGMTMMELATMVSASGVDAVQVGFMIGAAVYAFCPENEWFLSSGV
jgi:hypothetical protein